MHVSPEIEPPRRWPRAAGAALAAVGLAGMLSGCGHPATPEECETIIAKSAELELAKQKITDPATVKARTTAVIEARGPELMRLCVGKRITKRALECVDRATTSEEVDRCLD